MVPPAALPPSRFDVCNGDADGLCALVQWRLRFPAHATLVTGLKREIELLDQVRAGPGDEVLVCDLSMQRNLTALHRLLDAGARVTYFDHHTAGEIPAHPRLDAHIDLASDVCTSLLMDRHLGGAHRRWALVGAFGDNLTTVADALAAEAGLDATERASLRRLGEAINYNAYGETESDVHIHPARLFRLMSRHADPLELLRSDPIGQQLDALRRTDLEQALAWPAHHVTPGVRVFVLPDTAWTRRVIGCLANELAMADPDRAHAVLREKADGSYVVSLRAPQAAPAGAAQLCERFGGGGRAGAGGIDALPGDRLQAFIAALETTSWRGRAG